MEYLQTAPEAYFSRKEIARKAVHRDEYEANPHWADAALSSLETQHFIERNDRGFYRINPEKPGK
jgi:predicted transcriptional regulator of viral defense system